jgi:DNA-directed RNA polymerase subunit RPC12/RpoP
MSNLPPPAPQTHQGSAQPCSICGAHALVAKTNEITRRRRSKFGGIWLLVSILTFGLGFLLYIVWPRHNEVIGVDRYLECRHCGARQA